MWARQGVYFAVLLPHLWFAGRDAVLNEMRQRQTQDYTMTSQRFMRENFMSSIRVLGKLIQEWEATSEPVEPVRGRVEFDYEDRLEVGNGNWQEPAFAVTPLPVVDLLKEWPTAAVYSLPDETPSPEDMKRFHQDIARVLQNHHDRTFAGFLDEPHFFLDDRGVVDVFEDRSISTIGACAWPSSGRMPKPWPLS